MNIVKTRVAYVGAALLHGECGRFFVRVRGRPSVLVCGLAGSLTDTTTQWKVGASGI